MKESPIRVSPYGTWASSITAEALAGAQISFAGLCALDGKVYWTENVPTAGGTLRLFGLGSDGLSSPLVPPEVNVRTRVHEYGGAAFTVSHNTAYYSNFSDQHLYSVTGSETPRPLTPKGYRYADYAVQRAADGSTEALLAVREDHTDPSQVRNALVRIALPAGGAGELLYGESDFVAYPRPSPDGTQLAFITWSHPHMPWDATELMVADLGADGLSRPVTVAGGVAESVLDPQWEGNTLYFISDRSGFWNLYSWRDGQSRAIWPLAAEFARPLWSLGQSNFALLGDGRAVVRFGIQGIDRLAVVDLNTGDSRVLELPYVEYSQLTRIDRQHVAMIAGSAIGPQTLIRVNADTEESEILRQAGRPLLAPAGVSIAKPIDFPSDEGRTAHAFYYAPTNPAFTAAEGELPPLIALVHGGPTGQASPAYSPMIQHWTSRGFAVVDVNYAGSTGYGRNYRRALEGNWGVADAQDVIAAARYLGSQRLADPARTAIHGGSAGGYTVLVVLSTSEVFRAGADYYGVSDMSALASDTHKFESRYLDSLIGPLPEAQGIYDSRSPLSHLDGFKVPLIVFQGADDPVVPPSQSERIVNALRARGAPVAYVLFPGEGHGFRKPANIIRCLQSELSFYGQVFGFIPADVLPLLAVENLTPAA